MLLSIYRTEIQQYLYDGVKNKAGYVPRENDLPGDTVFLLLRLLPPLMDRKIHGGAQNDALSKVG